MKFRFIDCLKFLNSSLEKFLSYLEKSKLRIVQSITVKYLPESDFELVIKKAVFPYDYLTSYDKLCDSRLPTHESFYNRLCDSHVSKTDYLQRGQRFVTFSHRGIVFGAYSDLYLILGVLYYNIIHITYICYI